MEPAVEFRGKKEEQNIARQVFLLMLRQGAMYELDAPIRQSLSALTDYFLEHQILRREREEAARLIEAALNKNDHVFARLEHGGEVFYVTSRRGRPVAERPEPTLPPRQLHPAPEGSAAPRRRVVRRPPLAPFWVRTAIRQMQAPRTGPQVSLPTAEQIAIAATRKAEPVTELRLEDGTVIDFRLQPEEIFAHHGRTIGRVLRDVLERDFRVVSFGDAWYLEEEVEHFSKSRLAEIRRYILEEETPLSDRTILADLFLKKPSDPDYELWAFSLNARLLREKKEFEYVGVAGAHLWTVKDLLAIGSRAIKATEVGQDYAFLLEEGEEAGRPEQLEHFLTFYEYRYGVLPYDARARAFFPPPFLEEQRSAYLRLEIPQHYEAYAVELRYPAGNRGGWLWGLEEFFHSSLVPGALITISRTEEPNVFVLQYLATEAQERRLLTYDERRNRYTFEDTTFYCEVEESLLLSEERFPRLRNTSPLPPAMRRRPADVVAHAFTLVGRKEGAGYRASLEELYPVVNIERPFSMAYLQRVLDTVDVFSPTDEEGVYLYTPAAEE
ncbi:MAG: hypothetical protein ACP5OO_06680 [Chloroflexia bacterium]